MFDFATFDIAQFEASAGKAARLLKAMGNERRLMILCRLIDGEQSVGQIQPAAGLSQSALSQHLAVLRAEGVLATRRDGATIWYRIDDPAAVRMVATLGEIFCPPGARSAAPPHSPARD